MYGSWKYFEGEVAYWVQDVRGNGEWRVTSKILVYTVGRME